MKATLQWADYTRLVRPDYFYTTVTLYRIECMIYKDKGVEVTGATHPTRRFEYPWAFAQASAGERCLDAGGGIGPFCFILKKHYKQVTVLEICEDGVRTLNAIVPRDGGIVGEYGDLRKMRFPDLYFDDVFCISVLEHGPIKDDFNGAVGELLRVTKRRLVLTMDVGVEGHPGGPLNFEQFDSFVDHFRIPRPDGMMQMLDSSVTSGVEPLAVACVVMDKTKD